MMRITAVTREWIPEFRVVLVLALFIPFLVQGQGPEGDWYYVDPGENELNGIGIHSLYKSVDDAKQPREIIVAILDSGVDTKHEDLIENIWINQDEVPGNGLDDDGNGYVDDIHGWNFLGGPNGEMVTGETLEVTRLYRKYKEYFKGKDVEKLSKKDQKLYDAYLDYKRTVERERGKIKRAVADLDENEQVLLDAFKAFEKEYPDQEITEEFLEEFKPGTNPELQVVQQIFNQAIAFGYDFTNIGDLKKDISMGYEEARAEIKEELDYNYNPDFDGRAIIQDNFDDPNERNYGNNNVGGTFTFHGTHVAGIVGAAHTNDLGVRGIAPNVKLMILRVVPNGDEYDKDIANAIRYAAENGASIINMSFGKGYSPRKKVVDKAVKFARKRDVLMVHAAGNSAENNDAIDHYPIPVFEKKGLFGPKEADNWIEVGALSPQYGEMAVAPFSNYGANTVDIFAPGMQIYSTAPEDAYQNANGTSMAAPVVSGVAALIRSYYPDLTAQQVKDILVESAHQPSYKVQHPDTGELVDFSELCKSHGYIDANNAFRKAATVKGKKKIKPVQNTVDKA